MKNIGFFSIIAWCVFSALARVLTSRDVQLVESEILCFYTFIIAEIVFLVINLKNIPCIIEQTCKIGNAKNIILLNTSTFGSWFFLILSLKYIEPSVVSTVTMGLLPVSTLILGAFIYKTRHIIKSDILVATLLLLIIIYTIIIYFCTQMGKGNVINIAFAFGACFIVGIATAAQNIYSKKLSEASFSPASVLIIRFPLMIIICFLIIILKQKSLIINLSGLGHIFILSLCLVIIPLYMVQVAIKNLEPITISIVSPFMPIFVFIFEGFDNRFSVNPWTLLALISTSITLLFGIYMQYKRA